MNLLFSTVQLVLLGLVISPLSTPRQFARKSSSEAPEQTSSLREPSAVDPIKGILMLFDKRPIIALDEGPHRTVQTNAFFRALVQDPRFAKKVNDIVVEFGTSRYQDVMDRYVMDLEIVSFQSFITAAGDVGRYAVCRVRTLLFSGGFYAA